MKKSEVKGCKGRGWCEAGLGQREGRVQQQQLTGSDVIHNVLLPLLSFKKLKWKRMPWLAFSYIHSVDPFSNCFILLFSWLLSVLGTGGKSIVRVRMQGRRAAVLFLAKNLLPPLQLSFWPPSTATSPTRSVLAKKISIPHCFGLQIELWLGVRISTNFWILNQYLSLFARILCLKALCFTFPTITSIGPLIDQFKQSDNWTGTHTRVPVFVPFASFLLCRTPSTSILVPCPTSVLQTKQSLLVIQCTIYMSNYSFVEAGAPRNAPIHITQGTLQLVEVRLRK